MKKRRREREKGEEQMKSEIKLEKNYVSNDDKRKRQKKTEENK